MSHPCYCLLCEPKVEDSERIVETRGTAWTGNGFHPCPRTRGSGEERPQEAEEGRQELGKAKAKGGRGAGRRPGNASGLSFNLLHPGSLCLLRSFLSHHCAPESRSHHCLLQRHGGKCTPSRSSELLLPTELSPRPTAAAVESPCKDPSCGRVLNSLHEKRSALLSGNGTSN